MSTAAAIARVASFYENLDQRALQRIGEVCHDVLETVRRPELSIACVPSFGTRYLIPRLVDFAEVAPNLRLSLLYAPAAPEFFDRSLFRGVILKLREMELVWLGPESRLMFDERMGTWATDAKVILGRELRHTIMTISPETAKKA